MKFRSGLFALLSGAALCGCVMTTRPPHDRGFAKVSDLHSFEGCYANAGEGGRDHHGGRLSAAIWPRAGLDHAAIEAIGVAVAASDTLRVTAVEAGRAVQEGRFVLGSDFKLQSGHIRIGSHVEGSLPIPEDGPALGFLIVPAAGRATDISRFRRLADAACEVQ